MNSDARERTVKVRMFPLCQCGREMDETKRVEEWKGLILGVWRCPARRWWNAWKHPDEKEWLNP